MVIIPYMCNTYACAQFHTNTGTLAHNENRQHIIYDAPNFSRIRFRARARELTQLLPPSNSETLGGVRIFAMQ